MRETTWRDVSGDCDTVLTFQDHTSVTPVGIPPNLIQRWGLGPRDPVESRGRASGFAYPASPMPDVK